MSEAIPEAVPRTVRGTFGALAGVVHTLGAGDRADLRRYRHDHGPIPLAFYKLAAWLDLFAGANSESRWATLATCCAHLSASSGPALGEALARAGYSELRLSRLLRAPADRLHEDLPALARFLSAKGQPADFSDAAALLFQPDEDGPRQSIARAYFRTLGSQEKNA